MSVLGFPNPVDEKAARTVAAGVALLSALTLLLGLAVDDGWFWLTVVLALGFVARVLTGPTLSPLGRLATQVVAPRLGPPRLVPGPPKRFAQAIGTVLTVAAVVALAAGTPGLTASLLAVLLVFATLESVVGFCAGCWAFGHLMRLGVIPESTCEACADISRRQPSTV